MHCGLLRSVRKKWRGGDTEDVKSPRKKIAKAHLYFELIPSDALENIVRFLSESPRANDWHRRIPSNNIAALFGVSCDAQTFIRSQFHTVHVLSKHRLHEYANSNIIWALKKEAVADLIACGAEFIDTLVVDTIVIQGLHRILDRKCPNLRKLAILNVESANEAKGWLRKFGAKLQCLQIECFHPSNHAILAIEKYCPGLREVYLRAVAEDHVRNTALWKTLGDSVQILTVQLQFAGVEQVACIQEHCRKITRIHLEVVVNLHEGDEEFNNAYADCIASYGDALECATVFDMGENQLQRIVSSCSNARFTSNVSQRGMLLPTLSIMGRQLEKVNVGIEQNWGGSDRYAAAWSGCSNLREFHMVDVLKTADMGCFMTGAKFNLRKINICIKVEQNVKQFVDVLADGTGALEVLDLRCLLPQADAFDRLVEKNKSSLASVTISYATQVGTAQSNARILETFLAAPGVHHIEINDYQRQVKVGAVERICHAHRNRRVCVSILGVQYMK